MRRVPLLVLLAGLSCLPAVAADGPRIGGRLLAPGGEPLAEAQVLLYPLRDSQDELRGVLEPVAIEPAARALTGPRGQFALVAPHAGLWRVRVEAPGFVPQITDLTPLLEPVELPDVEMALDAGLSIRVIDMDGQAVAGARVLLRGEGSMSPFGRRTWNPPLRWGESGADGTLRLPRGELERSTIAASGAGLATAELRGLHGTAATLRMRPGKPHRLVVQGEDGRPVGNVMVALGSRAQPLGLTDEQGRITVSAAPGKPRPLQLVAPDGRRLETRLKPIDGAEERIATFKLPDRLVVAGKLIDGESRRALAGGLVWDAGDPTTAVITDRAGGFALFGTAGQRLEIAAGAPGYMKSRPFEFQLADDGRPGPTIPLSAAAAITGKVIDAEGQPIASAEVELKEKRNPGSMRIEIGGPTIQPRTLTDARGAFRLSPVDPDKSFMMLVDADGFAPAEQAVGKLEPYKTKSDLRIELQRGRRVIGRVVDAEGRAIGDVTVELEPAKARGGMGMIRMMEGGDGGAAHASVTDSDGAFDLAGLPAGKFDLTARRPGFAKRSVPAIEVAEDAEPVDLGEIVLEHGESLQGVVLDRNGLPLEGVEIFVAESGPMMFSMGEPGMTAPQADAVSDPAGWFVVPDLSTTDKYSLSFKRTGYVDHGVNGLQPPQLEPLEVELQPASDVSGVVLDPKGEPIAGAQVNMSRTRTMEMGGMAMQMMMMTGESTDGEGRFLFEDQEPGEISLSAVASGYQEAKLDSVEIPRGEDLEGVELPLPVGAVLHGRVLASDGRPAINATVRLVGEESSPLRIDGAYTDGAGNYRLEGLAPGAVSIEATHDDYPRVVRDTEVDEGLNSLDLDFEGGQEVSGRVVDTAGEPVSEAVARLVPAGRTWGGTEARSGSDGAFTMPGVQEGDYRLWVDAEGYASSSGEQQVRVESEPIQGLEVRLDAGAAIFGKVSGLAPERFKDVGVRAEGGHYYDMSGAGVDHEGNYRLEHLPPGDYDIVASVSESGKQARGQVTLEAGMQEVRVDLQFGAGLTLSGRAVQGERPVSGATLFAEGVDIDHEGWTQTDHQGAFSLEGLEPGSYRVHVREFQTGLAYTEEVELATSREITLEVPTAEINGRVVDATDNEPLAGVSVRLGNDDPQMASRLPTHTATTDLEGNFRIGSVADGQWRLAGSKKGYAAISEPVRVQDGRGMDDLRIRMDPTEGMTIEARLPSGAPAEEIRIAVLDPSGAALVNGNYSTGENGRVRLSSVPPGTWDVVVSAAGSATSNLRAQAPGSTIAVALQQACTLRVNVPALSQTQDLATVHLQSVDGQPFRSLSWTALPRSEWRMSGGEIEFASLPPGNWTVTVATADGRRWSGSSSTQPGSAADLRLE